MTDYTQILGLLAELRQQRDEAREGNNVLRADLRAAYASNATPQTLAVPVADSAAPKRHIRPPGAKNKRRGNHHIRPKKVAA